MTRTSQEIPGVRLNQGYVSPECELPGNDSIKASTTSKRWIFFSASINLLTVRSGSAWTMNFIKAMVGLGFPFGFKLSHSLREIPNLWAKSSQFFTPRISLSNKMASSSNHSCLSRRVVRVPPSITGKQIKINKQTREVLMENLKWYSKGKKNNYFTDLLWRNQGYPQRL